MPSGPDFQALTSLSQYLTWIGCRKAVALPGADLVRVVDLVTMWLLISERRGAELE
jgi:hypothetical protein